MSIATMILGESGTGKSTSMRNLNPDETLLIQTVKKPLPFRSSNWKRFDPKEKIGNVFVTDQVDQIMTLMTRTRRKVIVIDDYQYMIANEFMRRTSERGYDKFTEMALHAWQVAKLASELPDDVRVYILSHTDTKDDGTIKAKTIGKLLDEKITLEGLFSIVLRTGKNDGGYYFRTKNSGSDTVKTPIGLFESETIDNDLANVDKAICEYYELNQQTAA